MCGGQGSNFGGGSMGGFPQTQGFSGGYAPRGDYQPPMGGGYPNQGGGYQNQFNAFANMFGNAPMNQSMRLGRQDFGYGGAQGFAPRGDYYPPTNQQQTGPSGTVNYSPQILPYIPPAMPNPPMYQPPQYQFNGPAGTQQQVTTPYVFNAGPDPTTMYNYPNFMAA